MGQLQMKGSDWSAGGPRELGKWRALMVQQVDLYLGKWRPLIGQQVDLDSGANGGL